MSAIDFRRGSKISAPEHFLIETTADDTVDVGIRVDLRNALLIFRADLSALLLIMILFCF